MTHPANPETHGTTAKPVTDVCAAVCDLPEFDRPIIVIDIEGNTAGDEPDPFKDQILSLALVKINPDGMRETKHIFCRPEFEEEMNPRSTEIHGITWGMVKDKPRFLAYAPKIHAFIQGCDFVGYNHVGYDIPLLHTELNRCGIWWNPLETKTLLIDASTIFKKMEPRDLTSAVKKFCGREHAGAHGALDDANATLDVLVGQITMYPELRAMSIEELAAFSQMNRRLDLLGAIVLNEKDEPVYTHKKVRGVTVASDPGYAQWIIRNDFPVDTKQVLQRILNGLQDDGDQEVLF